MMQSMKGATSLLSGMNRQMNLPALQRIAMEFERENDIMDQRQEMMDDAIDDVTGLEDEEEGEEVVNQVLDEIGVDLNQAVSTLFTLSTLKMAATDWVRWARRRLDYKRTPLQKIESPRRSAAPAEKTTTSKHEWTTFDADTASGEEFLYAYSESVWSLE
jgi:division protein CdvB (Snf7/Vps24/ESCRT-III family)